MEGLKEVKGRGMEEVRDKEVNKEVNKSLGKCLGDEGLTGGVCSLFCWKGMSRDQQTYAFIYHIYNIRI